MLSFPVDPLALCRAVIHLLAGLARLEVVLGIDKSALPISALANQFHVGTRCELLLRPPPFREGKKRLKCCSNDGILEVPFEVRNRVHSLQEREDRLEDRTVDQIGRNRIVHDSHGLVNDPLLQPRDRWNTLEKRVEEPRLDCVQNREVVVAFERVGEEHNA
ncbi:hypothetical protein FB45DRAFT_920460 [Roridomyces roridus]|uniref:Uncharacterized protein n=1 Tax=Roridomyces roridus TaxID=1738132 RepID=A0AAD7FLJ3_9AGAR|nr:hypothetical protein FB45DRAFT_920460 [Roridomyces roridus]